jgi:hypothetical protein
LIKFFKEHLRFVWLGWYSSWGWWKVDATRKALDLWKLRVVFGKWKPIGAYVANQRFERLLFPYGHGHQDTPGGIHYGEEMKG